MSHLTPAPDPEGADVGDTKPSRRFFYWVRVASGARGADASVWRLRLGPGVVPRRVCGLRGRARHDRDPAVPDDCFHRDSALHRAWKAVGGTLGEVAKVYPRRLPGSRCSSGASPFVFVNRQRPSSTSLAMVRCSRVVSDQGKTHGPASTSHSARRALDRCVSVTLTHGLHVHDEGPGARQRWQWRLDLPGSDPGSATVQRGTGSHLERRGVGVFRTRWSTRSNGCNRGSGPDGTEREQRRHRNNWSHRSEWSDRPRRSHRGDRNDGRHGNERGRYDRCHGSDRPHWGHGFDRRRVDGSDRGHGSGLRERSDGGHRGNRDHRRHRSHGAEFQLGEQLDRVRHIRLL